MKRHRWTEYTIQSWGGAALRAARECKKCGIVQFRIFGDVDQISRNCGYRWTIAGAPDELDKMPECFDERD